jgi:hypothetical protein
MLIACPSCQRQLNVPDNAAGKQVRCPAPDCGTIFTVAVQPAPAAPVMKAAPAKLVPKPAAPKPAAPPPQAAGSPFDFGGGGVVGPEADFGFTAQDDGGLKGIGLRTRLNRGAGLLNMAAGSMVVFVLAGIGMSIAYSVMEHAWAFLVVAGCMPFVVLPFPIVIAIGARMLSRTRRWGLALTATILCLAIGAIGLILLLVEVVFLVIATLAAVAGAPDARFQLINTCAGALALSIVTVCSLYGGIIALRTLLNAEIKKSFT